MPGSGLSKALQGWAKALANFVIPPCCAHCQAPLVQGDALCASCWRGIHFIRSPLCDRLGVPLPYDTGELTVSARALADPPDFDRARTVAFHEGPIQHLVSGFKYADRQDARRLLARLLAQAAGPLMPDVDLIVPVPLHPTRLRQRRYNQSALLAKELGRLTGKQVAFHLLLRTKQTAPQVALSRAERMRNPRGAFQVAPSARAVVAGSGILLVDDVLTTGATVNACARALRSAGAARVDVVTVTRTRNPSQA